MKKKVFVVTLEIAIEAKDENEASDCINGIMGDQDVVDWMYMPVNGVYIPPLLKGDFNLSLLKEGDIFRVNDFVKPS